MRSIGIRELRQNASRYLRDVERGETIEITQRGRRVAQLVPPAQGSAVEQLIAAGRLRTPRKQTPAGPPLEPAAGMPLPSQTLLDDRADER
jgi:prevent-host-death family protein